MKNIKRLLLLIMCAVMIFTVAACRKPEDPTKISVGVLKGATGMGAVKAAKDSEATKDEPNGYSFTFYEANAQGTQKIKADVLNGTLDIAALPINEAAGLYNESNGKVEIIATNALGVLSIIGKQPLSSFAELKGKTIHTVAEGSTPEYALKYIIEQNGLTFVKGVDAPLGENGVRVVFHTAPQEVIKNVKPAAADAGIYGMLPEPATTNALNNIPGASIIFDVTAEWDKVSDTKLVQGCLVANKEFADKYPNAIAGFLKAYKSSVDYVNNASNVDSVANLLVEYAILTEAQKPLVAASIPRANIVCEVGKTMKDDVKAMLTVLFNADPTSINGKLPNDDFYGNYKID